MAEEFDVEEAKKYLASKEKKEKEEREEERKKCLEKTLAVLKNEFENSETEVYLVGSITRPFAFTRQSDIDIVIKNYHGFLFDLWPKLENAIGRTVEVILFEQCHFADFVLKEGLKVV